MNWKKDIISKEKQLTVTLLIDVNITLEATKHWQNKDKKKN